MKKIIIATALVAASLAIGIAANAQTAASSTATQTVNLNLTNAIDITFTSNNTATGAAVNLAFATVNDYANGVESGAQQMKVRSNKAFTVTVKANAANFTYSGSTTPAPTMPVSGVLDVKVSANTTGGTIAGTFAGYTDITATAQNMITGGTAGNNQLFSVQYKATPGFAYPAGTYTTDVVYTATQQ